MEWSVQEVARLAGTTSRTLRHYDQVGLLRPDRIGANGFRYYRQDSLLRLQRILLLRGLGLGLAAIGDVLERRQDTVVALANHLELLAAERERLDRQIISVATTLEKVKGGQPLMAHEMFDGFDHTQYKDEVTERWGQGSWDKGDRWWTSLTPAQQKEFQQRSVAIAADFGQARQDGKSAESPEVQALCVRHYQWLSETTTPSKAYILGLGEMYVADARFSTFYDQHAAGTAALVRDALRVYAEANLTD